MILPSTLINCKYALSASMISFIEIVKLSENPVGNTAALLSQAEGPVLAISASNLSGSSSPEAP
jgi:hypothetical protein